MFYKTFITHSMKKNLWILAAALCLAACSQDNEPTNEQPVVVTDNDFEGVDGQVVIQLGGGDYVGASAGVTTRVPITNDNFTVDTTDPTYAVGIFAVDPTNWNDQTDAYNLGTILNNIKGYVVADTKTQVDGADISNGNPNKITLCNENGANPGTVHYYPLKSTHNYSFYGYAPYQEGASYTGDGSAVAFSINGSQDIMWAKAQAITIDGGTLNLNSTQPTVTGNINGYNARYVRLLKFHWENAAPNGTYHPWVPNLNFEHQLVQLRFFVKAADQQSVADKAAAADLSVKDIKVLNHGTAATMALADGTITCNGTEPLSMLAVGADAVATDEFHPENSTTLTQRGYLLVKPSDSYEIQLTVSTNIGVPQEQTTTIVATHANGFQAGYMYDIQIGIYAMQEVEVSATMKDWEKADDGDIYLPVE